MSRSIKNAYLTTQALLVVVLFIVQPLSQSNVSAVRAPPAIEINKCCRIGEQLDGNQQCTVGGTEQWWPVIYLIQKQNYFSPRGNAPRFMRAREEKRPNCAYPELFTNTVALFSNGSLFLGERNTFIDMNNYCVDKDVALVCLARPQDADSQQAQIKLTKIRKCCGHHSVYFTSAGTCVPENLEHNVQPDAFIDSSRNASIDLVYGFPSCTPATDNKYVIAEQFRKENLNVDSGNYRLASQKVLKVDEFCIDHTIHNAADNTATVATFACADLVGVNEQQDQKSEMNNRFLIYSIALIISVIFLLLTLAIGFLLPSNHHVLHCRCQTYYVSCLLIGDLLLAINQLAGSLITGVACSAIATLMQFFFLAAFFWLNVMCFNIWWTFRDFRPTTLGKKQEKIRLRVYKIYAWGFAFLITFIAAVMDNLPEAHTLLRPRFGEKKCWFVGDMEVFVYFFGPIGFLLFVNIVLFASTTRQLMCGLWNQDDVKSTTERAALGRVCMKLVVVMGITWIADVLSWAHNAWISDTSTYKPSNDDAYSLTDDVRYYFWYVTDAINALQGVLIFLVVASQPQVIAAVSRFFTIKNSRTNLNTTNAQQHSSSSHGLASVGESMANHTFNSTFNNKFNSTFNSTANSKVPMETIC